MAGVFKFGPTLLATKETGATTRPMERASSSMLMVTYTTEIGATTKLKAKALTLILMEPTTKVSGSTISSTAKELRAGPMVQGTREIMRTERKKDQAN